MTDRDNQPLTYYNSTIDPRLHDIKVNGEDIRVKAESLVKDKIFEDELSLKNYAKQNFNTVNNSP